MKKLSLFFTFTFIVVIITHFSLQNVYADKSKFRQREYISLYIGISKDLDLPYVKEKPSFKGSWRKVTGISWSEESKTLRFDPKREGVGTITVHDTKGKKIGEFIVDVKKSDLTKIAKEIKELLGEVEGINVKILNSKVIVDGQILLPSEMNRIHGVIRQYDGVASSLVTLSPLAQRKIAEFIQRDINNPEIQVRAINEKFILEGWANSEDEKHRAIKIAQTYIPDVIILDAEMDGVLKTRQKGIIIDLIKVKPSAAPPPGKIIQLVVHYVELQKDYQKGFRFQWTPGISDATQVSFQSDSRAPGGIVSTLAGTINNLLPKLNSAKQHGHARVLHSSSLIVQDGKKGTLRSISKIPYQVLSTEGVASTNFSDVGLQTVITPSILGEQSDSISLDMDFSLSSLISHTQQGPTTSQSSMQTVIVVRSGQSAAVGGLISNSSGIGYNRLPPDVQNPIVSLYASRDFRRNQSQFVVFVTPIIKSSASAGAEKIKEKFRLRE